MLFAKWRHYITARGSDWVYPRTVLCLGQGMTIWFFVIFDQDTGGFCITLPPPEFLTLPALFPSHQKKILIVVDSHLGVWRIIPHTTWSKSLSSLA